MKNLLLLFTALLLSQTLSAQSCDEEMCQTSVLNVSTAFNHNTGQLYQPGDADAFWQLISVPANAGNITVPRPAFVIPSEPIFSGGNPFFNVWAENEPNSGWISGQPINSWSVNGGPYTMERCFCICEPGEYTINLEVWADDQVDLYLYDDFGSQVLNIGTAIGFAYDSVGTLFSPTIFLDEGTYCLQAELFNNSSTAMGLNIQGAIEGAQMLTSVCCNTESSIVGRKYHDLNCNGSQDDGEPGLANWVINLSGPGFPPIAVQTDQDGYYAFIGLDPGTYNVFETLQGGWTPSLPTAGQYTNVSLGAAEALVLNFGNCEGESCINSDGLQTYARPGTGEFDCCYQLDYTNTGGINVHGIRYTLLNGVEFAPGFTIEPGFFAPIYNNTSITVTNDPFNGGPMIINIFSVLDFCLHNVNSTPQYMVIDYLGDDFETVICSETILFDCGVTNGCLDYLQDELVCTDSGYMYTIDFEVPPGNIVDGGIGYIELHLDPNNLPPGSATVPMGYTFTSPLQPGDQVSLQFPINTGVDLFGDTLCVIITAHDDEEERICCFAYEGCLPFPECIDPCDSVSVTVLPITDEPQAEYCCFDLFITDTYTGDPNLFTSVQTNIITPGVTFDGLNTLPALIDGWIPTYNNASNPSAIDWNHNTGIIPNNINYNLFDFCVAGSTSTDSVYIEINWMNGDQIACTDTVAVYCPYCLTVVDDQLYCQDTPAGVDYVYQFSFVNHSPFDVNAVALQDAAGFPGVVGNPGVYLLGATVPPGGTYSGSVSVTLNGNAGDEVCFDLILRQIIGEGINITCCYATHCVELLPCSDLPTLDCPVLDVIPQNCLQIWDPVCGCDGNTYSSVCHAENAGIFIYTDGPCDLFPMDTIDIVLDATLGVDGVDLVWNLISSPPIEYDYFVILKRGLVSNNQEVEAIVPANGMDQYLLNLPGALAENSRFQVIGVSISGALYASNTADIFPPYMGELGGISSWPNPARDEVYVYVEHRGAATVELLSSQGQLSHRQAVLFDGNAIVVPLNQVSDGIHLIRVEFVDGTVLHKRIVRIRE